MPTQNRAGPKQDCSLSAQKGKSYEELQKKVFTEGPTPTGSEATGHIWLSTEPWDQVSRNTFDQVEPWEGSRPTLGRLFYHLSLGWVTISNFSVVTEAKKERTRYFLQEGDGAAYLIHKTSYAISVHPSPSTDLCHLRLVCNAYLMFWSPSSQAWIACLWMKFDLWTKVVDASLHSSNADHKAQNTTKTEDKKYSHKAHLWSHFPEKSQCCTAPNWCKEWCKTFSWKSPSLPKDACFIWTVLGHIMRKLYFCKLRLVS